jgi:hypothetical protein
MLCMLCATLAAELRGRKSCGRADPQGSDASADVTPAAHAIYLRIRSHGGRHAARVQVPSSPVADTAGWRTWLRGKLDERRWRPADLIRAAAAKGERLESSQVTRWLRTGQAPSFDSVRAVCAALGVPVVEGLVAAGRISPAEVGASVTVQSRPIEDVGHRALLDELARRLGQTAAGAAVQGSDVPLEWPKTDAPSRRSEGKGHVKRA